MTLQDSPSLYHAVCRFVDSKYTLGIQAPIDALIEEVGKRSSSDSVYNCVLSHKLLDMKGAIEWFLFMSVAPNWAVQFYPDEPAFPALSAKSTITPITEMYDRAISQSMETYFDEEDEEDEEDEDEEEGGEDDDDDDDEEEADTNL